MNANYKRKLSATPILDQVYAAGRKNRSSFVVARADAMQLIQEATKLNWSENDRAELNLSIDFADYDFLNKRFFYGVEIFVEG